MKERKKAAVWGTEAKSGIGIPNLSSLRAGLTPANHTWDPEETARITLPLMPAVSFVDVEERGTRHDTPLLPSEPVPAGIARAVLVVMTGIEAGRVVRLDGPALTFGRDPESDVWVEDPGVSRRHARVMRGPDGGFCIEDLGSRNGTFVGLRRVSLAELSSGDHLQLGPTFVMRFTITDDTEESLQRQLYESSVRDPLTGVFNRKYLADRLSSEIAHAHRTGGSFAVLMIDIDHFKEFNDAYGHLAGDKALRHATTAIARTLRAEDILARFGGEEFVVVARATDGEEALALAERLRCSVENLRLERDARLSESGELGVMSLDPNDAASVAPLTVSVGVAQLSELDPTDDGPAALIGLADQRLYGAKLRGRNRVCAED